MTPMPLTASTVRDSQQVALVKSDLRFRAEHGPDSQWNAEDLAEYAARISRVRAGFSAWRTGATS